MIVFLTGQVDIWIPQKIVEPPDMIDHIVNVDQDQQDKGYDSDWVGRIEVHELEDYGEGEVQDGDLVEVGKGCLQIACPF